MKLRKIIVVRHADFINSGEAEGTRQSEDLSNRIEPLVDSTSIVLLTSDADRAWQTAKPICRKFKIQGYIETDILYWIEPEDAVKAPKALDLIEYYGESTEIIIITTHLDYLDWLPPKLAEKYLGIGFSGGNRGYARGWIFDIEKGVIDEI